MSHRDLEHLNDFSMLELFRMEVETQSNILSDGLLALERETDPAHSLGELMRAAHSLKGAARIVDREFAVRIAHAMEDCFVAAQKQEIPLTAQRIDTLLEGVDLLNRIAQVPEDTPEGGEAWPHRELEALLTTLSSEAEAPAATVPPDSTPDAEHADSSANANQPLLRHAEQPDKRKKAIAPSDRSLRVTAENLDRLMGLAGEARVASRWLETYAKEMLRLKQSQHQLSQILEGLRDAAPAAQGESSAARWIELKDQSAECQHLLSERLSELELFDRRFTSLSARLYHEVLACRMRPFADGIQGLSRMVREVSRSLGKSVKLEVVGESTPVDRDILERLKPPLDHLLRNAIDHGIETPGDRRLAGKPEESVLQLQACHSAGMLLIAVLDDGRGVDLETVRRAVAQRKLTTVEATGKMTHAELLEFLFLPGFTLKESVSEISGRGVGLDIVQTMVKDVGGRVRISSRSGGGTRFQLELPLTLSVVRTLLAQIGGESYAFPLARVDRALSLSRESIQSLEGRQHFAMDGEQIGLVAAHQVLDLEASQPVGSEVSVIVLGDKTVRYGLVVDRFLGERELVVRALDARLGKVNNISSAALMPDGSPVLVVDTDDLIRSIENLASGQRLLRIDSGISVETARRRKRVLVVDDSLTVRELERKLLDGRGYAVETAVDGMDGWNAVRTGHYDLVVTDVDMPRLDGIELLTLIRNDHRLKSLPVMIVSYKDRPEDRNRGLDAGADYYLTKASFQDETLLQVVADLIGGADS